MTAALLIDGSWSHAFDSSLIGSLSAGYDDVETGIDYNSFKTYSGGFGLYKELPKGITVNLNGELRLSEFDAMHPIAGIVREDRRYMGSVAFTKRDFNIWGYALPSNTLHYNNDNIRLRVRLPRD